MLFQVLRAARVALAVLTAFILVWAVLWVGLRPWRQVAQLGPDVVTLRVMHWAGGGGPQEDQIVADLLRAFQDQHPHIRVERINPGDAASFFTKLQTMMAAGAPPDVFYMGSERVASFAGKDLLVEVEPLIEADIAAGRDTLEVDDFYRPTVDCFRFDGRTTGSGPLYGFPKDFTTIGFYYNKNLFDQAGLPYPPNEWTWGEFIETARQIGQLEGVRGAEFVAWPAMIRAYLWTEGLRAVTPDFTELNLDDPEVYAALERLRSWRFEEEDTLTSGKSQVAQGESMFLTGKVGMAGPFGRWPVPSFRQIERFEWDFAPLPHGKVKANAVFTVAWSIARQSPHRAEAWELLKFLVGPAAQKRVAELGLAIPTLKSVAQSDAFIQPHKPPTRDRVYLDQVDEAEVMRWPEDSRYESQMANRFEAALRTGAMTLDQAIARLQADWRNIRETPLARTDFPRMPWGRLVLWLAIPAAMALAIAGVFWWRRRPGRIALREELAGYAMVGPWIFGFLAFMVFPIVMSLLLSCAKWSGMVTIDEAQWVGGANYLQLLFHDERFWVSLRVTAYYALLAVPFGQCLALIAALLMAQPVKFSGFFRSAWYLPSVLAGVGIAILWRWVFDGDHGLMNNYLLEPLLTPLGVEPPQWFDEDARWFGPPAFAIMSLWAIGGPMVIYLAGLQGIPRELYEAASIDGATRLGRFRNVTLPMLSPIMFFNGIIAVIASFQVFTQAYVMTGGGPGDDTRFYVLYLYNQAFEFQQMGYASAMAWLLLIITLGLTLFVMRGSKRFVYYEALK